MLLLSFFIQVMVSARSKILRETHLKSASRDLEAVPELHREGAASAPNKLHCRTNSIELAYGRRKIAGDSEISPRSQIWTPRSFSPSGTSGTRIAHKSSSIRPTYSLAASTRIAELARQFQRASTQSTEKPSEKQEDEV
jgi:hypothetical protein